MVWTIILIHHLQLLSHIQRSWTVSALIRGLEIKRWLYFFFNLLLSKLYFFRLFASSFNVLLYIFQKRFSCNCYSLHLQVFLIVRELKVQSSFHMAFSGVSPKQKSRILVLK